jgi:hypothetical protein
MRLEENIHGLKKAEKLAKKNGWKIVKTIPANASESARRARRFNESNDQEKEFSYKGVVITRYDYESLPMPMAASKLDDETMQKIAEDIYYMLLDHGWEDKDIDRYLGRNLDELEDENDRDANMIKEDFWEYMENAAVANGMEYYSEMEDGDEYMESKKFGRKFNESKGLEWLNSFRQAQDFVDKACEQLEVVAFEGGADVGNSIHKKLLRIWSEMRDVIESV